MHYAPKFIQTNISLWLVDCTFIICSVNYITSKDFAKTRRVSSPPNTLAMGFKLQKLRVNWQSHIFAHGWSNCDWLLVHNSALMRLENFQHFFNLHNNFWFNAISQKWFMCKLIFCKKLAESDITVTPSVKCMDWLHRWYNHAAHSVSSSTATAFLNNMSEKCKSTPPSAVQVKIYPVTWEAVTGVVGYPDEGYYNTCWIAGL